VSGPGRPREPMPRPARTTERIAPSSAAVAEQRRSGKQRRHRDEGPWPHATRRGARRQRGDAAPLECAPHSLAREQRGQQEQPARGEQHRAGTAGRGHRGADAERGRRAERKRSGSSNARGRWHPPHREQLQQQHRGQLQHQRRRVGPQHVAVHRNRWQAREQHAASDRKGATVRQHANEVAEHRAGEHAEELRKARGQDPPRDLVDGRAGRVDRRRERLDKQVGERHRTERGGLEALPFEDRDRRVERGAGDERRQRNREQHDGMACRAASPAGCDHEAIAMQSISTRPCFGSSFTATVARAGLWLGKRLP